MKAELCWLQALQEDIHVIAAFIKLVLRATDKFRLPQKLLTWKAYR
jgi:hypothetical protein